MAKRDYSVEVKGNRSTWSFDVYAKPEHVADWRKDGLIVHEVVNTIPNWAVDLGLTHIWCFIQDALAWRPWSQKMPENDNAFLGELNMMAFGSVTREMPRYQSHKKVHALKIKEITPDWKIAREEGRETDGSAMLTPEEEGYAPFKVDHAYMTKHQPIVGGYYVVYEDGYKSFSPAEAFESGYTCCQCHAKVDRYGHAKPEPQP